MEHVTQDAYNPHAFITVRRIQPESNDNMYQMYKATEIEEVLNRVNLLEQRIEHQEKKIGQVIDNLTLEGWYSDSVDKDEVLRDLCTIFDHNPQQEMSWTATLTVSGTTLVNLDEVNDFDIRYHIGDNLSVDSNDFQTNVDSWDVDYIDSQEWN